MHLHSPGPLGGVETAAFGLGFQHLPRDLANVNAWKTMFDPYIRMNLQITNLGLVCVGVLYLIRETTQRNTYNQTFCDKTMQRAQWRSEVRTQENHKQDDNELENRHW